MGTDRRDVEIAVPPSEGGEGLDDFVAGPIQVFPDTKATSPPTTLSFTAPPSDGDYVAGVLVDGIVRDQSAGVALPGCTKNTLPHTGSLTIPMLATGPSWSRSASGSCEEPEPTSTAPRPQPSRSTRDRRRQSPSSPPSLEHGAPVGSLPPCSSLPRSLAPVPTHNPDLANTR